MPAEPVRLRDLRPAAWRYALRRTLRESVEDDLVDSAAALTYYAVLSAFPALLAVLSLVAIGGRQQQAADSLLTVLTVLLPPSSVEVLRGPIQTFASSSGAPLALVGTAAIALLSASGYVSAFARSMNRVWEVQEGRPFALRKAAQVGTVLVVVVLAAVLVSAGLASAPIARALLAGAGPVVVASLRWPVLGVAAALLIAVLYATTPNVRRPPWRWLGPGSVAALLLVAVVSAALGAVVRIDSHYGSVYGPLVGVVLLLVWLWIANLAVLLGAELDAELERARQLQAGLLSAKRIATSPRSARALARRRLADVRQEAAGERLARTRPPPPRR